MSTARIRGLRAARWTLAFCVLGHATIHAAQPGSGPGVAPPLREGTVSATRDLGRWDDVFVPQNQDFIVLRRGAQLFTLAMGPSAAPRPIAKAAAAEHTEVVGGAVVDRRCWLFLASRKAAPCALDVNSGTVVTFDIPGLKVPGSQAPTIQSCVLVPHGPAAILMVSGGDRATWPRDGNRPVYFWIDLNTGKTVRFPIGWDLNHFSADLRVAVFSAPAEKPLQGAGYRAVATRTGEPVDALPDLSKEPHVPFDWGDTQTVKPLYEWRAGNGSSDFFVGLSIAGREARVDLGPEAKRYLATARADDSVAGFRLRLSGSSGWEPWPFWIVPLEGPRKAVRIAEDVSSFTLLGKGNAVYVTACGDGDRLRDRAEAFYHRHADSSSWNVLAGVPRLPELDKKFAGVSTIKDRTTVQLVEGFGSGRHGALALCLHAHNRGDYRALRRGDERLLDMVTWRRALLVTHDGRRYLTSLFREGNLPDRLWLHNSGRLLLGPDVWSDGEGGHSRGLQLSEVTIALP